MTRRDRPGTFVVVTPRGYEPSSPIDWEVHARFKPGALLDAGLKEARNEKLFRKMWKLFGLIVDATGEWHSAEAMSIDLRLRLGFVDSITLYGGGLHLERRHFEDFSKDDLDRFYEAACAWIWQHLEIDADSLLDEDRRERESRRAA